MTVSFTSFTCVKNIVKVSDFIKSSRSNGCGRVFVKFLEVARTSPRNCR